MKASDEVNLNEVQCEEEGGAAEEAAFYFLESSK